jgi:AcrR family transcriptional regulator
MSQDKKKTLIIEAAQKRFSHFGVGKTTMNEIADDLSISKASLYYYFPDKLNLYAAVLQKIIEAEESPSLPFGTAIAIKTVTEYDSCFGSDLLFPEPPDKYAGQFLFPQSKLVKLLFVREKIGFTGNDREANSVQRIKKETRQAGGIRSRKLFSSVTSF